MWIAQLAEAFKKTTSHHERSASTDYQEQGWSAQGMTHCYVTHIGPTYGAGNACELHFTEKDIYRTSEMYGDRTGKEIKEKMGMKAIKVGGHLHPWILLTTEDACLQHALTCSVQPTTDP
ncbi:hypothetical protein EVAR_22512_1 [Eumeta japonica]|uniref:Uncharacterized protein n=1 Tax=Eumeta variegata TaxID=151549 RepID=A0A4C1U8L7_EUMVA|nr:hypothetical protein EVAR_22512_1 [Eumeta japonica]